MTDSTDSISGKTGLTVTVTLSKNGAAFGAAGGAVTEIGNGWYYLAANTTDTNTLGDLLLHATANLADSADLCLEVDVDLPGASVSSVSGAVGSVTGAVGSVTGAVGSVAAGVTVTTNNDKTGYTASTVSDKTGYSLSSAGVQAIWDALTSSLTTVNSIGKMLVTNLTGDIFARLGAPAGASHAADVAAVKTETAAIKLKTDNLPATPASQGDVTTVGSSVTAIKAKTDNLPATPAAQSDVTTVGSAVAAVATSIAALDAGIPRNAIFANFPFPMVDASGAPLTGLTVTAKCSIDGGAFADCANAVVEIGLGKYKIALAAADLNGKAIALQFSAPGAANTDVNLVTT